MRKADRLSAVPPYFFAEMDRIKRDLKSRGIDLIDLGIGDPDVPTPHYVVEEAIGQIAQSRHHRYPAYEGSDEIREAVCEYYKRRFGVALDPGSECMALIGSKEGLAHLIWAFVDPGDVSLVPDPAYPVYRSQTLLSGGVPYEMPLREDNGFLPDLDSIPKNVRDKATIMFLNYPNNPTAAVAPLDYFRAAVDFAGEHGILLCHDAAYVEMTYDGYRAPSILEVPGAGDVAVEMYSWSKPFNMTGWRIAAMVGSREAVEALRAIKTNTDSGQFTAIQMAAIEALRRSPEEFIASMNGLYQRRRDILISGLHRVGLKPHTPKGSFYIWCPVPPGHTSASFSQLLLERPHIVVVPGTAYGSTGEGYVRMALTVGEDRLEEACSRLAQVL